ncbi:low molecular weight protein-tyrosine-phosphatase [Psychrobacter sp. I-STPA6b]|uniref:low molecular weight protein-tyrosine-phosphatase n=1 Tax=Psychrobacter sp. I-STPA6b TaxID=2585718 RepID=UPI001D0C446A|nr:low molecular weight protein-tyrosine-phosphatase [Psychrobacter sp. I-STPA6b]
MPIKTCAPKSILLVCLGNICRSPTAEEVLRQKAAVAGFSIDIDSAGTGNWHAGEHPDKRAISHAKANGYAIHKLIARQVQPEDFQKFELILAMDKQNLQDLQVIKDRLINDNPEQSEALAKLALFSEEDPIHAGEDVPDPYYGGDEAFERCIAYIESGANAWIESWKSC